MANEILDKIRKRRDNPICQGWQSKEGEQKALSWVLRLFSEYEKSITRKVLVEKMKKKKSRKSNANLNEGIVHNDIRPMFDGRIWHPLIIDLTW